MSLKELGQRLSKISVCRRNEISLAKFEALSRGTKGGLMPIKRTLTDIPDNEVEQVILDFESEGCTTEKNRQPNGKWTVVATCPEKKKNK